MNLLHHLRIAGKHACTDVQITDAGRDGLNTLGVEQSCVAERADLLVHVDY